MLPYLLCQVRNPDDPMAEHEVNCFARVLECKPTDIAVADFIHSPPSQHAIDASEMVLFGGSGDYSVAEGGEWLDGALETMRLIVESGKPTFASCWGFQAMAKALGGDVEKIMEQAEVGSLEVSLTEEGKADPLFGKLPETFVAQMGHQDIVTKLPPNAILLASTDKVKNQAFRIEGKPVYCTQFHPELDRDDLLQRLQSYPRYIKEITGLSYEEFIKTTKETPELNDLVTRFKASLGL